MVLGREDSSCGLHLGEERLASYSKLEEKNRAELVALKFKWCYDMEPQNRRIKLLVNIQFQRKKLFLCNSN